MYDVELIVKKQREFFNSNITKDVSYRIKQLRRIRDLLKENEQELYDAIYEDFGKSEFETYVTELSLLYREIRYFTRKIGKWSRPKKVPTCIANFPASSRVMPEPLGNTLVFGAWNYPYQLSLMPAISALAAGNTVILKPSELPARTSSVMARIINENFEQGFFHVIEGGVKESQDLLKHRFDKMFFTGSIPVGRKIYEAAAKHLTPVTLELGGKSPTFVLSGCDIKVSVKRIVWGKFINAGQTCIAPDYILLDRKIETEFMEALKKEINKFHNAEGEIRDNYTRIINEANFDRLARLVEKHDVCFGGVTDRESRLISPTIMKNISFDDEIMKDEIFGPIIPVISFDDLDSVIAEVKSRPKPLACYVYAKDRKLIKKILGEISFGGGGVNESLMHFSNSNMPFGGVGYSGIGSYHGRSGFDDFSHYKGVLSKPFWFEAGLKYPPYTKRKLRFIKWLLE